MDRVYKEERNHILSMVKKIKATGCNVLLIQKSILRDAVTDLSLHYLVRQLLIPVLMASSRLASPCSSSCACINLHIRSRIAIHVELHAANTST